MAVKNTRKPRIALPERTTPPPQPVATSIKMIKGFEEILQRCREMTEKYQGKYRCITNPDEINEYIDAATKNGRISIDTETTGLDVFQDYVVGFSLYTPGTKACYVPLRHLSRITGKIDAAQAKPEACAEILRRLPKSVRIKMANAQFDLFMLKNSVGVDYSGYEVDDVLLMGRILDTERKAGKRSLKDFHADYCEHTTRGPKFSELFQPGTFHMCPYNLGYTYAARDAEMTDEVDVVLQQELAKEPPLQYIYNEIERPLLPVLFKMRERGVLVDQAKRAELTKKYRDLREDAVARFEAAYAPYIPKINQYSRSPAFYKPKGRIDLPVKIGSDDQLKVLLWEIMKLPAPESRKVDKGVLYGLNNDIANAILDYRKCTKLLSTYLEGIEKFIQKDGCVHGGIRQIGADTGRTSSCIAEGTLVECPGESKPIEQIRVGDEVYTYDDAGNLCVRKVTGVMDNGYRQCMTLKWQSSGTQECGSLTCTPDHMIKTKDAGWVMADHLKPRQKVFHLRARETETERVLSGTNGLYCAEHHWLKFNYFMCEDSSLHIHHEDGNHKDNHMILSASDAGICHVYDLEVEDTHCYIAGEICVHNCDPNMQNIPSRNRDIRQIYRARPGCVLISCDYSGQEPRLTASLCKDPEMVKAYQEGKDLYAMIAAVAFDTTYEECLEHRPDGSVNKEGKERRSQSKVIVLGICYGRQIPSIADQLNCTIEKAQGIYDKVTKSFPGLLKAQDEASEQAHQFGYVSTLWGRRRHLTAMMHDDYEFEYAPGCNPDFDPFNPTASALSTEVPRAVSQQYLKTLQGMRWWRERTTFIETLRSEHGIITTDYSRIRADMSRKCLNAQIQGSAADMSKLAMVKIENDSRLQDLNCRLLLMVHDEVICECPKEHAQTATPIIQELMESVAAHLPVPFKSDPEITEVWYGKEINYDEEDNID